MQDLQIINAMLRQEAQQPVASLTDTHPMIPTCLGIIQEERNALLSRGWWFNTVTVTLQPNSEGAVLEPTNALQTHARGYVPVDGRLMTYDGRNPSGPVKAKLFLHMTTQQLPEVAAAHLVARCRFRYAADIIKDPTEYAAAERDARETLVALNAAHIRQQAPMGRNRYQRAVDRVFTSNYANRFLGTF